MKRFAPEIQKAFRTSQRLHQIAALAGIAVWLSARSALPASVVNDTLIDAVAQIESNSGRFTIGDNGKANGWWQMHETAWRETTAWRRQQGQPVWSYSSAHNSTVARLYARDYLTILEKRLNSRFQEVTPELIYAAYNVGFSRLQRRGFQIHRTPRSTQTACAKLRQFLGQFEAKRETAPPPSTQT